MDYLEKVFLSPILPLSVILLVVLWKIYNDHQKSTEAGKSSTQAVPPKTRDAYCLSVYENGNEILIVPSRDPFPEIEEWFFSGEEPCLTVELQLNDRTKKKTVLDRSRHTLVFSTYSFLSSDD